MIFIEIIGMLTDIRASESTLSLRCLFLGRRLVMVLAVKRNYGTIADYF